MFAMYCHKKKENSFTIDSPPGKSDLTKCLVFPVIKNTTRLISHIKKILFPTNSYHGEPVWAFFF